jgi:hypothetical protein
MHKHTHTRTHVHISQFTLQDKEWSTFPVAHEDHSSTTKYRIKYPTIRKAYLKTFVLFQKFYFNYSFIHSTISCETSNDVLRNPSWKTMVYSLIISKLENTILLLFLLMHMMVWKTVCRFGHRWYPCFTLSCYRLLHIFFCYAENCHSGRCVRAAYLMCRGVDMFRIAIMNLKHTVY